MQRRAAFGWDVQEGQHTLDRGAQKVVIVNARSSAKTTLLDDLLKPAFCRDAYLGFQLAAPRCSSPSLPRDVPSPCSVIGGAFAPKTQEWASSADASASMPKDQNWACKAESSADASTSKDQNWACKGCGTLDITMLSSNSDGSLVCDACGVVDAIGVVALDRQKNCPREEDKTIVADVSAAPGAANATAAESAHETRKRHLTRFHGTVVSRRVMQKCGFAKAQARVDTAVLREGRQREEVDPRYERKLRSILRVVEACFDQLGGKDGIDTRIQKHIRIEAARVLSHGMRHARHCDQRTCEIGIASRSNAVIAVSTVQAVLERLVLFDDTTKSFRISSIAPECSHESLLQYLDSVKQLNLQNAGVSQRSQVHAIVGIVLDWVPAAVCMPCVVEDEPMPALQLPPSLAQLSAPPLQPSTSSASLASNADSESGFVYAMRDLILSAARLASARSDVRNAALGSVNQPVVLAWLQNETLPVDVLAVVVLAAAARKLEMRDTTPTLLKQVCHQFNLSPTSTHAAIDAVSELLQLEKNGLVGAFGDGIF